MTKHKEASLVLDQFVPYRMVNLAKRMSLTLSQIYANEFDLTIPEWRVVATLGEKRSLNAKAIGVVTMLDKSTLSRAIALLDTKGYVSKTKDSQDQRASLLTLTEKGADLYHQIVPKTLSWEEQLIHSLSATEYRDFMRVLHKLDTQIDIMSDSKNSF